MDFLIGFILGLVWYEYIVLVIACFMLYASISDEGGTMFAIILVFSIIVSVFKFEVDFFNVILPLSIAYIAAGLLWSFFKWSVRVKSEISRLRKNGHDDIFIKEHLKEFKNNDKIFYWVVAWPLSISEYIVYDALKDFISKFGKVYDSIVDRQLNKI